MSCLKAIEAYIGGLVILFVATHLLAQLFCCAFNIQNVVGNLEGQTQQIGKFSQGQKLLMGSACQMGAAANGCDKQGTSLTRMELAQLLRGNLLAFELKVQALSAHHTEITGTHSHFPHGFNKRLGLHVLLLQHDLKGQSQQAVASQNCHGFAINLVVGQPTTKIIIIVHAGQIIMNQGIGMNHF